MKSLPRPTTRPRDEPADNALQVPALQRGLALLEHLAGLPDGATLSELSASLDISLASVFRLAGALEELGYLRRDEKTKRFAVTQKLLLLGQPHSGTRSLVECSLDAMRRVLAATSETTQLCCRTGAQCVVIEQLPSKHPFKYIVDLGSRPPAYCCAPGKAMLAFLPEEQLDAVLPEIVFTKHTANTITSRAKFLVELERIRACGYALDRAEHFEGIHCIAAPLLDRHGHAIAAITIAGPSARIPESAFEKIGRLIIDAARDAARRFQE